MPKTKTPEETVLEMTHTLPDGSVVEFSNDPLTEEETKEYELTICYERDVLGYPLPPGTVYMNRALFLCGFFGQSYFDLLL